MESIRIKNLHCLKDTGVVPLNAINILVGANSSGKSSFLRTFPLLKQGLNTNKIGPILWLSEDVDFGDFKTAVKKGEDSIELEFEIKPFLLSIKIIDNNGIDYINQIIISFFDQKIHIDIDAKNKIENIIINNEIFKEDNIKLIDNKSNVLPGFYVKDPISLETDPNRNEFRIYRTARYPILDDESIKFLKKIIGGRLSENTIHTIREKIGHRSSSKATILKSIQAVKQTKLWASIVNNWDISNEDFNRLNNRLILSITLPIVEEINARLSRYLRGLSYIAPVRATAERYYRRQNLALDSIDSRGLNLPMFINDLTEREKRDLKDWMIQYFGFSLQTDYSGGHIAIYLMNEDSNDKINLADSGFGFSQVLPIILVLWTMTSKNVNRNRQRLRNSEICYFVIEQPELHLHPAFQAKLVDAFVSAVKLAKDNSIQLKLILETHSEAIINRLGHRISESTISSEDVTVALFSNNLNEENKNVTLVSYTKDGFLENWPIGFFNAD